MMEHSYQFNPKAQIICFKNIEYEYHEMDFKANSYGAISCEILFDGEKIYLGDVFKCKNHVEFKRYPDGVKLNSPSLEDIIAKITGDSNE